MTHEFYLTDEQLQLVKQFDAQQEQAIVNTGQSAVVPQNAAEAG